MILCLKSFCFLFKFAFIYDGVYKGTEWDNNDDNYKYKIEGKHWE